MPRRKEKKPATATTPVATNIQCGLCCKPVVDDHDEALLCEGSCEPVTMATSMLCRSHCLAVRGPSRFTFTFPLFCVLSTKASSHHWGDEDTIDSLTAEVTELRSEVADLRAALQLATAKVHTSESTNAKRTEVVRRRKKVNNSGVSNGKSNPAQSQNPGNVKLSKPEHQHSKQSSPVCGARRIWGTLSTTTVRAV